MQYKYPDEIIQSIRKRYIVYFGLVVFSILSIINVYDIDIVNNTTKELAIENIKIRLFPYLVISLVGVIFQYIFFSISLNSLQTTEQSLFVFPVNQLLEVPINHGKKKITLLLLCGHLIISLTFYLIFLWYTLKTHEVILCLIVIGLSNFYLYLLSKDFLKVIKINYKWFSHTISISLAVITVTLYFTHINTGQWDFFNLKIAHQTISDVKQKSSDVIVYSKNLSNRNFNGADFSHCVIKNTDFTNSSFKRANLTNTNFSFSNFKNCNFKNAKLIYTNFQQRRSNNHFDSTYFYPDTLFYVNYNKCNLTNSKGLKVQDFSDKIEPSGDFLNETIFPKHIIREFTKDSEKWNKYRIVISDNIYYSDTVAKYDKLY